MPWDLFWVADDAHISHQHQHCLQQWHDQIQMCNAIIEYQSPQTPTTVIANLQSVSRMLQNETCA
eukprot:5262655-Karenia_brevis.AAC.1